MLQSINTLGAPRSVRQPGLDVNESIHEALVLLQNPLRGVNLSLSLASLPLITANKSELGEPLFGHTSAVYIELAGKTIFQPEAAKALIADMQQAIKTIQEKAKYDNEAQRDEVLDVYRQGIASLRKRLEP